MAETQTVRGLYPVIVNHGAVPEIETIHLLLEGS